MNFNEVIIQLLEDFGVPFAPQNVGPNSLTYSAQGNLSQKPSVPSVTALGDSAGGTQTVKIPKRLFTKVKRKSSHSKS